MTVSRGPSSGAVLKLGVTVAAASALLWATTGLASAASKVAFRHIAFDTPLDVTPRPDEPVSEAVRHFHALGENRYVGNAEAAAEGRRLYETWCQACHMPGGSGRIGPSLIDDVHIYSRTQTDVGLFETIYGGAFGAMQPFSNRLTQDEILKLIAHLHTLRKH